MAWRPDYITLVQAKEFLRIKPTDTQDDAVIATAITSASRAVDTHCHRQFGQVDAPQERRYTAWKSEDGWRIVIDDLDDVTGMTVSIGGVALAAGYTLEPVNAVVDGFVWTELLVSPSATVQPTGALYEVSIVAPWGWTAFPVPVVQACEIQMSRIFARRKAPFGIAGSPDQGSELRLLARVDPDVAVLLAGLVRLGGVG